MRDVTLDPNESDGHGAVPAAAGPVAEVREHVAEVREHVA